MRNPFLILMTLMLIAALLGLSAQTKEIDVDVRARELIGMPVAAPDGAPLGVIAGLLLDVRDAGLHYALVAFAGERGEKERRFAYPLTAFRRSGSGLALDAPPVRRAPPHALEGGDYVEAARLLGRPVEDRIGNIVGWLEDIVLNLHSGRSRKFLVAFFDQPGGPLALPASLVRLQAKGNPVLHAEPNRRT